MAKSARDKPSTSAEEELKRRKKQARQEAKLMLEIEAAKRDLKKAQKRQSKAQARLEERSTYVQTLEARLAELRAPGPEPEIAAPPQSAELEHQQEQAEMESSIVSSNGKQLASHDQEYQGEISASADQAIALPQVEGGISTVSSSSETGTSTSTDQEQKHPFVEEATPSEVMVMTNDVTEREAVQAKKIATESDTSSTTTPGKASTQKTAAARTSRAIKRSTSPSTTTKRPANQSTATKRPASRSQSPRKSSSDTEHKGA